MDSDLQKEIDYITSIKKFIPEQMFHEEPEEKEELKTENVSVTELKARFQAKLEDAKARRRRKYNDSYYTDKKNKKLSRKGNYQR